MLGEHQEGELTAGVHRRGASASHTRPTHVNPWNTRSTGTATKYSSDRHSSSSRLGDVRYVNILLMGLVAMICAISVQRALGTHGVAAFGSSLLITGFYIAPLDTTFSSATYLMLGATAAALEFERRGMLVTFGPEFWLSVGALAAFFDLFTLPILTLGMPLVAVLLYRALTTSQTARRALMTTVVSSALWLAGYAASWSAKWVVSSIALHRNVFVSALSSIAERTGVSD